LNLVAERLPLVFPVHPRTRARLEDALPEGAAIQLCEPLPYLDFLGLMASARLVLTDSGGIQEETTVLNVPCLTLRENTERPVTLHQGTNRLVGIDRRKVLAAVDRVLSGDGCAAQRPPLWDGRAAERLVAVIVAWAQGRS
jgi:UDP-N-acetylglucosamine 2-epimerase (non-hydrolysing)